MGRGWAIAVRRPQEREHVVVTACDRRSRRGGPQGGPHGHLARDALPAMRDTLQAFADADINLTRAARALHVHPNTLRYRLARIHERTGRDPNTFEGLVDLLCLVTLLGDAGHEDDPA